METGVVIIQEQVLPKTSVEEAPAVVLDHSTMEVDKVNLSTAIDDCRNSIIPDVAEVVNGSGNKESKESKHERKEAMKTISVVEDSKIVGEIANETETDEQGTTFVHEPESFNKDSQEHEKDIGNISKVLVDTAPVKSSEDDIEKILDSAREEIPIKTDEVKEEADSKTVENSETEDYATVSVEEISRNGENIVKEAALEEEASTDGVSVHDVETTKGVLEAEKEAEPRLDKKEKDETETVMIVVNDPEIIINEENTVHESISLKENAEPVGAIKNSDDAEQVSREVTEDREKEEDIIQKAEEVQENLTVIETPTIQGEDIESKVSKDTEEHEHVLVRDIPQDETLVPNAETLNTSTVQESSILKTLETKSGETDAEPSLDLKEEEETVKTVTSSDEVQESIAVIEPPKTSPDQRSKDTKEDEHVLGRNMPLGEIFVTEAESLLTTEETEPIMDLKDDKKQEKTEKFEELPSDLSLKVDKEELKDDKIKADQVVGAPTMERGQELNESEAEQIARNRTDETEESPVEKLVAHPDVESVEHMEKPSFESPSELSEETRKTLDEKIEEKPKEEVPSHQEGQEEGSYGSVRKEETVSVQESSELGEKSQEERSLDLNPLKEESCLTMEKDEETKLQKEQIHKHEPSNEEVKSDEVIQVSSASTTEKRDGETVVEAKKIVETKDNEEEKIADKVQRSLETSETVDTEPVKSNEDDIAESLSSTREEIQIKRMDEENVQIGETDEVNEEKASKTAENSVTGTEVGHKETVSPEEISKKNENIMNETAPEDAEPMEAIKNSDDVEKISHEVTGDREKEEDITQKTEEVQESPTVTETPTIKEENIESKASKDTEEHEHVLVRDMPKIDTLVTEPEDVNTSTVQEAETSKTLETTINETEIGQETKKDVEPSLDLKEDKEKETAKTVISSDEVRPSDQVDVQVKSKETLQDESNEVKHEILLGVPSGESEKFQFNEPETVLVAKAESWDKFEDIPSDLVLKVDKEELKDDKTEVDKVDGTQVMREQRGLEPTEPEEEQIDRNKTDEVEETPVEKLVVESVEKMQSSSLECPSEVSEETSTTVDENIKEKFQEEEVTLHQEGQEKASYGSVIKEETLSVPESKDLGEELSCLPKETKLQQEQIEKYEPTNEVPHDQKSLVEETSNEVIQVSSASPSEERESGIVVDAVKLKDMKANEEEQVAEKVQKSLDSQTSLVFSEKSDNETLTAEAKKGDEETTVRDMPQGETIVTEAETVDTSTVQEAAVLNILERTINESEAMRSPIGGEEESHETKEDTEPRLDLRGDKEQEEAETVKTVLLSDGVIKDESQGREESVEVKSKEIVQHENTQEKDENLLDVPYGESAEQMQKPSLDSPSDLSEETSKTLDEKIEEKPEEVTLHQESQETKEETVPLPESSELRVQAKEEESCPPNEQGNEMTLQKEQIEKHELSSEEDSNAHQTPVEEISDEVIQVSSAPLSEEREGETLVEAEKMEDIKANEEEQVADKIQRSLETVETVERHSSFPSLPEESETIAEAEKIEDGKVKETEPMGDMSDKGLKISETKELNLPLEASRSHGTESSELVPGFEEQKPKQVKEILEGERKELDETKAEKLPSSETILQETLSDVVVVQLKREDNATESHERQEELSKDVEMEETTVAQEEQTRDIGTSLTQPEEQVNEEYSRDEQEETSSTEKGEIKTKEPEDANLDEHVDSSEKNENETLIAETKIQDEDITVSLDGSSTSMTLENDCTTQEEFENMEARKLDESKEDKSQEVSETIEAKGDHTLAIEANQTPSFISELVEEIQEEETNEARVLVDQSLPVETSHENQTPSLVSEENDKTPTQIEEIHEEETKEHKLQEAEILPTETVPRESNSEAPVSVASGEDEQVTMQEGNCSGDTQEELHVSAEKEESVGETKPKESEVERTEISVDQIETSTKVTREDEDTKETDTEVAEITKGQRLSHDPENACLKQEELKDLGTQKPSAIIEDHDYLMNENSDDFTFSKEIGEAEHGYETSSSLPVVGILKELQTTLEENERAINDSEAESSGNDFQSIKAEPETLEKNLVTDISERVTNEDQDKKAAEESPVEELKLQEEHREEGEVKDERSREFEIVFEEKLQEETKEIAECKETIPAEKILIPSSVLPFEESKQEEGKAQEDANASTSEKISLQEEHPIDFETSEKEHKAETHETVKDEDQIVGIKEEKKTEETQDEKLEVLSLTREDEETSRLEVKKEEEDAFNEVATSEKQNTPPPSEAEKETNEEYVESQAISGGTDGNNERDLPAENIPKDQREDVNSDKSLTKEALDEQLQVPSVLIQSHQSPNQVEEDSFEVKKAQEDKKEETVDALITSGNVQVQDQSKDFELEKKSNDLTYVQEDNGTNVKPEIRDDEIRDDGHDSVVAQKKQTGLIEKKSEVAYVKTEPEDAIKHGVSTEEKNNMSPKIDQEATKEISQEESKKRDNVTAIKEEIKQEEKETTEECFNSMKNTDDATEQTNPEIQDNDKLSSVSETQDTSSKPKYEVPNQQKREIADEISKLENLKLAEELQQKDGASENNKESEPTVKEQAGKSLSDLIQKVKGTNKTEDATTEPRTEEEPKTEEEDENGDEHKDDKTSPDSIVMVEAKDTVSIIKTHKKSQGILSGVGLKVKHSISKVKKALTGKSSHTTKPSSPQ